MGRHTKLAAGRKDMYYHMAKETGFRSRAAFKLLQLNRKFDLLSGARCLIDLCAAPGGWSQVAVQHMPVGSLVIAVDLDPIKHIPGVSAFQSDITSQHCRNELKKMISNTPVDIVVNDGAPNVTGDYGLDSFNQNVLVLYALKLASEFLKQGGTFVSKIFRSGEHMQMMYVLKQLFETAELTKPESSREASAEIFVVCRGFKGQFSEIDPKMFDPEIVLSNKMVNEQSLKQLVKDLDYNHRNRHGYETSLNRSVTDCVQFIISEAPIQILTSTSEITFDFDLTKDFRFKPIYQKLITEGFEFNGRQIQTLEDYMRLAKLITDNTDPEMIQNLKDIQQLSKPLLQKLLLWHRKTFGLVCQAVPAIKDIKAPVIEGQKQSVDELVQLQEQQMQKEQHQQQRKFTKEQQKQQLKQLKKFENFDKNAVDDVALDIQRENLFQIKNAGEDFVANQEQFVEEKQQGEEESEDSTVIKNGETNLKLIYEDDDQKKFFDKFDEEMNVLYSDYIMKLQRQKQKEQETNQTALISKGIPKTVTDLWFGQKEFAQKEKDDEEFADQFPLPREGLSKTKAHIQRVKVLKAQAKDLAKQNRLLDNLRDEHKFGAIQIVREDESKKENELIKQGFGKIQQEEIKDIEIVKNGKQDEKEDDEYYFDYSEEEMEEVDEEEEEVQEPEVQEPVQEEKAEEGQEKKPTQNLQKMLNKDNIEGTATKIALAQLLLRKKSTRALEESAFGKKFYDQEDDEYNLPAWFVQDELQNNQPNRPITAEEVAEIKEKLKEINEVPRTKKEREAIARKKMHAHQKLSAAQEKTQEIINREDLSEREKIKKLKQLQKGAQKKEKKTKIVFSNANKAAANYTGKLSRGTKFVDKRMKKEQKAEKRREKKYGKKAQPQKR